MFGVFLRKKKTKQYNEYEKGDYTKEKYYIID